MKYPPQIIEQLKARLNIVDEVRKVAPTMKKKGRYWWANCPFHTEKSPSFHVREDQGSYYCFGCGAAGDVLTFVQETQGGTFTDVIQRLARQVGIKLPEPENTSPEQQAQRQSGYKALERAAVFFQRSFTTEANEYIRNRGLTEATVNEFMLGFAPEGWNNTRDALLSEGFSPGLLRQVGLTVQSDKGKEDYDRFRNRIMFPIQDNQGRVVGFGGRVMDKSEPKYLNSAETPFFNKSYLLYNLHRARPFLKASGQLVLVEGYMDVIALYQAGFKTAVAPLGTAITEEQLSILWQQTPIPLVCLDGDAAGRTAALRVAQRALPVLEPGHSLQFVFLPQGEDPDSLVRKDGLAAFRGMLSQTTPLEQVLWQHLSTAADFTTADGRAALEGEMGALLATIRHATVRKHYSQILRDKLYQATRPQRQTEQKTFKIKEMKGNLKDWGGTPQDASACTLLAIVCRWPGLIAEVDEPLANLAFPPGPLQELLQHMLRAYTQLKLGPEELRQSIFSGPHSGTVEALLASTGVSAWEETDPAPLFAQHHSQWREHQATQKQHTKFLRKQDWFSPETWSEYKQLKENDTSPLTPTPRRPI